MRLPMLPIIRKKLFLSTVLLSLTLVASFALAAYAITVAHSNAADIAARAIHDRVVLCNAQNDSNEAVRKVLLLAQQLVRKAKHVPPKERLRGVDFYNRALRLVPPINCDQLAGPHNSR